MNEKIEKIKEHLKEHKKAYLIGVASFAAGAIISNRTIVIEMVNSAFISWKPKNEYTTIVVRQGHPGNVIRCVETGEIFPSQNLAAKRTGVNSGQLAQHLQGRFPSVKGLHFEGLGEAA